MDKLQSFLYSFDPEFEFSAKMPEELLVKAMHSTRPIFITDDFIGKVAATSPAQVVRQLVQDLHRDNDPDETADVLRWHYLFMDFNNDFPRLMMMAAASEEQEEE